MVTRIIGPLRPGRIPVDRDDIEDYAPLADELSFALGKRIAVNTDGEGGIQLVDNDTGAELEVDEKIVKAAIKAHKPKRRQSLADRIDAAKTVDDLKAVLRDMVPRGR